mgnify:CR=1 FL=1
MDITISSFCTLFFTRGNCSRHFIEYYRKLLTGITIRGNFNKQDLLKHSTDEIAKLGFFYLAQNPMELEGVKLIDLYKIIANSHSQKKIDPIALHNLVIPKFNALNMRIQKNTNQV